MYAHVADPHAELKPKQPEQRTFVWNTEDEFLKIEAETLPRGS